VLDGNVQVNDEPAPQYMFFEPSITAELYHGIGPFILSSMSNGAGLNSGEFTLPDAVAGDVVEVIVEVVGTPDPQLHTAQIPWFMDDSLFDLPATPAAYRISNTVGAE